MKERRRQDKLFHAGIITALLLSLAIIYYIDRMAVLDALRLKSTFLTGVHDVHRTLFLIPIVYAALMFRIRGALATAFIFLCVVLPRAFYLSPYPDPLLRALISVASSAAIGLLMAEWRNRLEGERTAGQKLKENQAMLVHAEKLASMGQLAASIAHEVNNPISGVLVYVSLMKKKIPKGDISREEILDYLSKIDRELARSARLIRNLLHFAGQATPRMKEEDLNAIVDRALDLAVHASTSSISLRKKYCGSPRITTDPDQLQAVLMNLIINGFQSMPGGGTLTVTTEVVKDEARIAVRDTGCGIPPENMERIFIPFFSTKKDVKGVGLGLPVSYGIVQRLNGRIEVESRAEEGSAFTVCLPLTLSGNTGRERMSSDPADGRGTEKSRN